MAGEEQANHCHVPLYASSAEKRRKNDAGLDPDGNAEKEIQMSQDTATDLYRLEEKHDTAAKNLDEDDLNVAMEHVDSPSPCEKDVRFLSGGNRISLQMSFWSDSATLNRSAPNTPVSGTHSTQQFHAEKASHDPPSAPTMPEEKNTGMEELKEKEAREDDQATWNFLLTMLFITAGLAVFLWCYLWMRSTDARKQQGNPSGTPEQRWAVE